MGPAMSVQFCSCSCSSSELAMACFSFVSVIAWRKKAARALGIDELADARRCTLEKASLTATPVYTSSIPSMGLSWISSLQCAYRAGDSEWANYDPDRDDYDVRTAPIKPASGNDGLLPEQIGALQRRIRKGGDQHVLEHYQNVIQDMRRSLTITSSCRHRPVPPIAQGSSRQRSVSGSSSVSKVSTCCPSDEDVVLVCSATTSPHRPPANRVALPREQRKQQRLLQLLDDIEAGC